MKLRLPVLIAFLIITFGTETSAQSASGGNDLDKAIAEAELQKLKLEIEGLKNRDGWRHSVTEYLPIITVLVAVGGFLFGIIQFQTQQRRQQDRAIEEQKKDRATRETELLIRIQDQIRKDVDELLQFTNDQRQTVSRAGFLLQNLKYQLAYRISEQQTVADIFPDQTQNITESLANLIADDCNFAENSRDASFASTVVDHWEDYRAYMHTNNSLLDFIMFKITRALGILHDKRPRYFEDLDYDPEQGTIVVMVPEEDEETLLVPYLALQAAFSRHLKIAAQDRQLRAKYIRLFQEALRNKKLTQHTFNTSFDD